MGAPLCVVYMYVRTRATAERVAATTAVYVNRRWRRRDAKSLPGRRPPPPLPPRRTPPPAAVAAAATATVDRLRTVTHYRCVRRLW